MARKLTRDISASTIQVILNQLLGLAIFYITSRYLSKESFGELNWSLAITAFFITTIGLGADLIVVRKMARGQDARETASLHFIHVLYTGIMLTLLLLLCYFFLPGIFTTHVLLPGILVSQVISYFSSPFKQVANGTRAFRRLAFISTISGLVKLILLIGCIYLHALSNRNLVLLFIAGSIVELFTGIFLTTQRAGIRLFPFYWSNQQYILLLKESFPQYGVTLFNVLLARFDWILLGIISTTTITAEYSFAYKAFELTRLPLLIISPILIPVFVKTFKEDRPLPAKTKTRLNLLFQLEMAGAALLPLLLASCWTPLVETVTHHKYGAVNENAYILLACCVPLQFATDYYWNMCFAQDQLKLTFRVSVISCAVNILLNFILIPKYGSNGAAIAYISCFVTQLVLFKMYTKQDWLRPKLLLLIKSFVCAAAALALTKYCIHQPLLATATALVLYILFTFITRLVVPQKIKPALKLLLHYG